MSPTSRPANLPFEAAISRFGTSTSMAYVALSRIVLLTGNHVSEPSGSDRAVAPSEVESQPVLPSCLLTRAEGLPE